MRISLSFLFAFFVLTMQGVAQFTKPAALSGVQNTTLTRVIDNSLQIPTESRAMAVCSDKVTYVDNNGAGYPPNDYAQLGGAQGFDAVVQSFPGYTGQVTRIDFKAQSYSGTRTVEAAIHAINASNDPIGSPLGYANVTVNATLTEYGANLIAPANVTNGFAVVIWDLENGDSIKVMSNSDLDGQGTGYSYLLGGGYQYNLLSWFNADLDFLLRPTISFNTRSVTLSANPTSLCPGAPVSFSYTASTAPSHYYSFIFNPDGTSVSLNYGDATPAGTSLPTNHSYSSSGTYNAQLTEIYDGWTSNCSSDPSAQTINVNPGPTSFFAWSATQLAVTFTNLSVDASSYAWQFGDAGTSAAPNPVHNYAASGTYTVELTATGTCGNHYYTTNISITDSTNGGNVGIQSVEEQTHLSVYPNPTENYFNIEMTSATIEDISVEILSPLGQIISSRKFAATNQLVMPVDLSGYSAGVYFIHISSQKMHMVHPIYKK